MKIIFRIFTALVLVFSSRFVVAGGIPVIDVTNLAQNIMQVTHMVEQIATLKDQLDNMVEQLQTAKDTLESMSDPRGYAGIINSTYSRDTDVDVDNILDQFDIREVSELNLGPELEAVLRRDNENAAWFYGNSESTLETSKSRLLSLARLVGAVDGTDDQKDVLDLQARTKGEVTLLQNEQVKLNAMKARAEAYNAMRERRKTKMRLEMAGSITPMEGWWRQ